MQAASAIKDSLRCTEAVGKTVEELRVYPEIVRRTRRANCAQGKKGRFAANAATRCGVEIALKAGHAHRYMCGEVHSNNILFGTWLGGDRR